MATANQEKTYNEFVKFYKGDFKDGMKHGNGTYSFESGDVYEGYWYENERNGVGIIAKDLNGTPRSPNKKCTLRRHPPEDFDDPIVQPINSLVNPGKGKYRNQNPM